jgi:glycosyltransferase involved in cell wall biosynthesis
MMDTRISNTEWQIITAIHPENVQFISLMSGEPWGGSEELWFRSAERLLDGGIKVRILSKKWDVVPEKISRLTERGADLRRYDEGYSERIRSGLIRRGIRARGPFRYLRDSDMTVVSLGSFADARWYLPITDELIKDGHPFITVFHNAPHEPEKLSEADRDFLWRFYSSANRVFYVAERNRRVAEQMLGRTLPAAELINNPVNLSSLSGKPFPISETLRLVCVGRLDFSAKGQDVLIRAMSRNWRNRDFELQFHGAGPDEEHLVRLVRECGLEGKLKFAGFSGNVDEIFANAHAVVLPSRYEGMPMVCVEAALCARPGMITDVGDSTRYFREGVSGFVAPHCDEKSVEEALERLWESRTRLEEMGKVARHEATRDFLDDGVGKLLNAIGVIS